MPSGSIFDLVLVILILILALWETAVAVRRREKKRYLVVGLALVAAGVLFWLRAPQWW